MSDPYPQLTSLAIRIELLDATTNGPIQSWEFSHRRVITIGRSSDQDIAIPDLGVSRQHVELVLGKDGWQLKSLGRSGVTINGQAVTDAQLGNETIFRLGGTAHALRFIQSPDPEASLFPAGEGEETMATMQFQVLTLDDLETQDRDEKVGEIVNSDFFNMIKDKARKLRKMQ